ncbi:hypothetical protein P8605_37620 [Streptomyces sp. T-3]|nr:hypothetical protein [Streptomyces sp. T-3]
MSTGKKITEKLTAAALTEATGKDWLGWFTVLDKWDATARTHTEIARHLCEAHGVNGWHAQSITVGYEQERGLRAVGQSRDGDWKLGVSKTVGASAERVIEAFADESVRGRWLPGSTLTIRTHRPGVSVTADFESSADAFGGASRIDVRLTVLAPDKVRVGLGHMKLPDAEAVATYKEYWRDRLTDLKALLEADG